ncbi:MAG: helix-turn-helix transcriptional regulator [Lachnospiraceae bacterium]
MNFCSRLENLLEERNVSQRQLSTELHIAPSTLNGYLRRNREPDFTTLIKLATFFKVSTDYLLGLTNVRCPYISTEYYNDDEGDLVGIYRSLQPQEKDYLIQQAHMYFDQDLSSIPRRK